jgi:Bardet-Biedl syndrome 1 protein
LWRLRLTAARETVEIINTSESTLSGDIINAPIKLSAEVLGLGPEFCLAVKLENMSARKEAANLSILLHADHRHYTLEKPYTQLPPLVPGAPLKLSFKVIAVLDADNLPPVDLTPENSVIRVMLIKYGQVKAFECSFASVTLLMALTVTA